MNAVNTELFLFVGQLRLLAGFCYGKFFPFSFAGDENFDD